MWMPPISTTFGGSGRGAENEKCWFTNRTLVSSARSRRSGMPGPKRFRRRSFSSNCHHLPIRKWKRKLESPLQSKFVANYSSSLISRKFSLTDEKSSISWWLQQSKVLNLLHDSKSIIDIVTKRYHLHAQHEWEFKLSWIIQLDLIVSMEKLLLLLQCKLLMNSCMSMSSITGMKICFLYLNWSNILKRENVDVYREILLNKLFFFSNNNLF